MLRSEAQRMRKAIEAAVQSLPDMEALTVVALHPHWEPGVDYPVGYIVQHGGKLWRCRQEHNAIAGWEPQIVASLWEQVCESHTGAEDDPIPYEGNMALTEGLCYVQYGVLYRCVRNTVSPVYDQLEALIGLYVELI